MTALTPDQIAAKWAANLTSAAATMTSAVNAVTVAPGVAAARNRTGYVAGVQASADKWAARVAAVPLQSWQQSMIQKGIPRIASGATAAQPGFQTFMAKLLPYQNSLVSSLPPRGTLDQNIARAAAMIRGMAAFQA